ncbi:MAG TPA: hypothetical protein VD999_07895 [Vitreimonas sp.]|nr:hypothetical protein [Vitreimonas sp.]
MAKITQYIAQGSPSTQPGSAYVPRLPGNQSEQVGNAITGLGETVTRTALTLNHINERNKAIEEDRRARAEKLQHDQDKQWATTALTRYQTRLVEREVSEQESMPPGGLYEDKSTYVDRVKGFSEEEMNAMLEEAPNSQAADFFKAGAFPVSERTYVEAIGVQAKESYRYALESNISGAQEDINLLVKKPELLDFVWNNRKDAVLSASNIGERNKQEILEKVGPAYAMLPLQRDLNEAKLGGYPAEQIVKDIDSGYYERKVKSLGLSINPKDLMEARDKAISLSKVKNTDLEYRLDSMAKDIITDAGLNAKRPPEEVYAEFEAAGKPKSWIAGVREKAELAADTSHYLKQIALDPAGFEKNILPTLKPTSGSGSARQAQIYGAVTEAIAQQKQALVSAPGDAASAWYQTVSASPNAEVERAMMQSLRRDIEDGKPLHLKQDPATGKLDPISETTLKVAYQRSQGIPEKQIEILGSKQAKIMAQELMRPDDLNPQGNLERTRQNLEALKETYGQEYFPKVMNELIRAGLPQEFGVLLWADGSDLSNKITATLQTNVKTYEDKVGLPGAQLTGIKENIASATATYGRALALGAPNGERTGFINSLNQTIYKLALQQKSVDESTDIGEFIGKTVDKLITQRFHITDTQAIPKVLNGKQLNPNAINSRLESVKRSLRLDDIKADYGAHLPLPTEIKQKELLQFVKDSGYWVTNGNSSGAYLVIDVGAYSAVPVLSKDSKRIERGYVDLTDPVNVGRQGYLPTELNVYPGQQ